MGYERASIRNSSMYLQVWAIWADKSLQVFLSSAGTTK